MIDGEIGVKINVDLDSEGAINHAKELNEYISKQKPSVKVQADLTTAKEQIATLSSGNVEKTVTLIVTDTELSSKLANRHIDVNVNVLATDEKVEAALHALSKHSIPVEIAIDPASIESVNQKTQQAATTAADQLRATLNKATTDSVTQMLADVDKAYKQITSSFVNIQTSVTDTLRNIESMQSKLDTALTNSAKAISENAKNTNKEIASSAQLSLDSIINGNTEATKVIVDAQKAEVTVRRETVDITKQIEQEKTAIVVAEAAKQAEVLATAQEKIKSFANMSAGVGNARNGAIGGTYNGLPSGLSMSGYPDQSEIFKRGDYSYGGLQSSGTTGGSSGYTAVPNGAALRSEADKKALEERYKLVMESEERLAIKQNEVRDFYRQADANREKFAMTERMNDFAKLLDQQDKQLLEIESAKQSAAQKDAERVATANRERSELNKALLDVEQRRLTEEESLRDFHRQADINAERMRTSELAKMYDELFTKQQTISTEILKIDNTLAESEKRRLAERADLENFYRQADLNAERMKTAEIGKMYEDLFKARKSLSEAEFLMQNAGMTAQGYAKYKEPQNYVAIPPQMAAGATTEQTMVELAKLERYQQVMASQQEKLNAAVTAKDIATREDAIHRIEALQQGSISRMLSMINESTSIEERYKIDAAVKIANAQLNQNKIVTDTILKNIQLTAEAEAHGFEAAMAHRVATEREMFDLRKSNLMKEADIQQTQDNAHYADLRRQREERGQMLAQGKAFVTSREDISILKEYTAAHSGLNTAMGMVHNTMGMVTNVLMQLGVYLSARQLLDYADHWMHFTSMVKVAMHQMIDSLERITGATEILNAEQRKLLVEMKVDEVFKISQDTRTSIEGTATLFSRMSRAVEAMGMGNDKAMILTKELGQALMIMGLNTQNARGALLQLEQALGGVVVRGQEFKSINDGIPIVMQVAIKHYNEAKAAIKGMNEEGLERGSEALAKYVEAHKGLVMSLPQGRALMLQGKMASAVYAESLLLARDELEALSKDVEVTFGQSFSVIENAFTKYLGKLNESSGVSKDFAVIARQLADNFDSFGSAVMSIGAGIGVFSSTVILSTLAVNLWNMALSRNPIMMIIGLVASLGTAIYIFKNTNNDAVSGINVAWESLWKTFDESQNPIVKTFRLIGAEFEGLKNTITWIQEKFDEMQKSKSSNSYGFGMFSMPQLMARAGAGETNNNVKSLVDEYEANKDEKQKELELAKVKKQLEALNLLEKLNLVQGDSEKILKEGNRILNEQVAINAKHLTDLEKEHEDFVNSRPAREKAILKAQDDYAKKFGQNIRTMTGDTSFKVEQILQFVRANDLNSLGTKDSSNYMRGVQLQQGLAEEASKAGAAFDLEEANKKAEKIKRQIESFNETLPQLQESNLQFIESQNKMIDSMYKKHSIGMKKAMVESYDLATAEIDAKTVKPRIATTTSEVMGYIDKYSEKFKVDSNLVKAIIEQESHWKAGLINKSSGATGLMQVKPSNFDHYGITDPKSIEQNIRAGVNILADVLKTFGGDVRKALVGYNWGTGNFAKVGNDMSRLPAETREYIPTVLKYYQQFAAGKEGKLAPEAIAQIQSLAGEYKKVTKEALVPDFSGQSQALQKLLTEEFNLMKELSGKAGIVKTKEEQADFELGKKKLATLRSLINDQESMDKEATDLYIKGLDARLAADKRTYEAQMVLINAKAKLQNEVELAALARNKGGFAIAPIQGMMLSDTGALASQESQLADLIQQQKNVRELKQPANEKILVQYERDILDANEKVSLLKSKISTEQSTLVTLLKSQAIVEDDLTLANEKQLDLLTKGAKAVETANLLKMKGVTADSQAGQNIIHLQDQKEMLGFIEKAGVGVDGLSQSLSTMFTDMLTQGKSATEALGDMFKSMLNKMIGAAMDFIAQGIVKQLFSGFSGGGFSMGGSLTALAGAVAIGTYMGMSQSAKLNTSQTSMTSDYPNGIPADASSMQEVDMSVANMDFLIYSKEATQFNKDLRDGLGKGFSLMYKQSDAIAKFAGDTLQTYFPETMTAIKSAYNAFKDSLAPITETVKAGYAAVTDYLGLTSGAAVAGNLSVQASSAAIASLNTAISGAITPTFDAIKTGTAVAGAAGTGATLGTSASTNLSNAISNSITPAFQSTANAANGAATAAKGMSSSLLSTIGFVASLGIEAYTLASSWDKLDGAMGKAIGIVDALGNIAFAASIATMGETIASMNPVLLGIAAAASIISVSMNIIKDGFTAMNISRMVGIAAGAVIGTLILPGIGTLLGIILGDLIGKLIGSLFGHQKKIDFGIIVSKNFNAPDEKGNPKYASVTAPTVDKVSKENRVLAMATNMGDVYYGRTQGLDYAITKQEKEFVTRVGNTLMAIGNVVGSVDKVLGNSEDFTRSIFRGIGSTMKRVEASNFDAMKATNTLFNSVISNLQKTNTEAGRQVGGWLSVFVKSLPVEYTSSVILALTESKQMMNTKTQAMETTTILQKMATESPIGVLEFIQKRLTDMVKSKKTVQQLADETFKAISDSTMGLSAINEQFIKLGIVMDVLAKKKVTTGVIGDNANVAKTTTATGAAQQDLSQTAGIVNSLIAQYKFTIAQSLQYASSTADIAHNIFIRSGTEANKIYDKLQSGALTEAPSSLTNYPTTVDKMGLTTTKGIITYGKDNVYGGAYTKSPAVNVNPVEANLPIFQKFFESKPILTAAQLTAIENLNYGSVAAMKAAIKTLPKEFVNQPWVMTRASSDKDAFAANKISMKELALDFTAEYRNRNIEDISGKFSPTDVTKKAQIDLMAAIDKSTNVFLTAQKLMGKGADGKEITRATLPDLVAAFKTGATSVAGAAQDYGIMGTGDLTSALTTISAVADKYTADTKKALDSANNALVVAMKNNVKADKIAAQKEIDKAQLAYDTDRTLQLAKATQEVQNSMGLVFEMFISASTKLTAIFAGKDDFGAQAQAFIDGLGGIDKAATAVDKAKKYALSEAEYTQMRIDVAQNRVDAILKSTSYKTLDDATKAFRANPLDVQLVNLMGAASDLADAMKKTSAATTSTSPEKVADFKKSLADWSTGLKITNLGSTKSQLDAAGVQYSKTLSRITNPSSDEDKLAAQAKITNVADSYLSAIKNFYGSSKVGVDLQQKVIDTVMDLPQAIDVQQAMLAELKLIKEGIYKMPNFEGISGDSSSVLEKLATAIKDIAGTGDKNAITEKATIMLTLQKMTDGATGADAGFLNKIIESIGTEKGLIATVDTIVNAKLGDEMQGDLFRALNTGFSALLLEVNEVKLDPTPEKIAKLQSDIDKFNTLVANINGAVTDLALDPKDSKLIKKVQDAMDAMDTFRINISILNLPESELELLLDELKAYFKVITVEILPSLNKELAVSILNDLRDSFKSVTATIDEFIIDKEQQGKAKLALDGAFNNISALINSTVDDTSKVKALGLIKDSFASIEAWVKAYVDPTTQAAAYNMLTSYYSAITATVTSKLNPTQISETVETLKGSFKAIDAMILAKIDPAVTQSTISEINKAYAGLTATVTVASKLGDAGKGAVDSLTAALKVVTATIDNVTLNPTADNIKNLNNKIASYGALHADVEAAVTALNTNIDPTKTQQLKSDLQTKITALGAFTAEATLKLAQDQQAFLNALNAFFGLSTSRVSIFANVDTTSAVATLNALKNSYTTLTETVNVIPAGDLATKAKDFVNAAFASITGVVNSANLSDNAKTGIFNSLTSTFSSYNALITNASVTQGAKEQASSSLTTAVSAITATVTKTNLAPDIQTTTTTALNTALSSMQVLLRDVGLNPSTANQTTLMTQLKAMSVLIDNVTGSVTKLDTGSAANKAALTTQLQTDISALNTLSAKVGLGLKDTAKTELDTAVSKITPSNITLTIKFTSWDAISKAVVDNIVTVKEIGDKGIVFDIRLPDIGLTPIQNLMTEVVKTTNEVIKMISGFDSMLTKAVDVQKAISLFATGNKVIEAYTPLKGEIRNKVGYTGIDAISGMALGNYLDTVTSDAKIAGYKKTGQYDVKSEAAALNYGVKMYDVFNDPASTYNKAVSYVMGYNSTHNKQIEMDVSLASDAMLNQGAFDLGAKVRGYKMTGTQKAIDTAKLTAENADLTDANRYYKTATDQAKKQAQNYYTLMGFNASSAAPYKFAEGGAFTNGIVTRPTSFDMGLMGEAGAEAIMPLTQTSSGGLGVRAVTQNKSSDNSSYEKKCEEEIAEMKIQNKILKAQNDIMQEGFKQLIEQARTQNMSLNSIKQTSKESAYA